MKELALFIHFVGLAMGLGTSFAMMFLGMASAKLPPEERFGFMSKASSVSRMGHIGLTLLVISGIYLIIPYWDLLGEMPLLITKLILVLALGALIGIMSSKAKKALAASDGAAMAKVAKLGPLSLLTALLIVLMAVLSFR